MLLKTDIDNILINFDSEGLLLVNIALAIVMYGVALDIKLNDFKVLIKTPKVLIAGVLSQFILLPFLTFLVITIIKPYPSFALGMLIVACCPGGNISNFYSKIGKGNTALSISLTAMATIVCVAFTPFNLQFWASLYEPTNIILKSIQLNPFDLIKVVALLLVVPLICGMLTSYYFPKTSKKINNVLRSFSILFFIILILGALFQNINVFKNHIHLVVLLVVFHNLLAYSIGFTTSKLFKLDKKNTRTITLETGIQNSGLGLLLVFDFFNGLGGMALLTAFWGVWDIFSGMLLAFYWNKKSINTKD